MRHRRELLKLIGAALVCSPAIVRASSLMPVKSSLLPWPLIRPMPANFMPPMAIETSYFPDEGYRGGRLVSRVRGSIGNSHIHLGLCVNIDSDYGKQKVTLLRQSMWQALEMHRQGQEIEFKPRELVYVS